MQRGVGRRVHWIALTCLTETIPLGALPLNRPGVAPPQGRGVVRGTAAGSAGWRCGATTARCAHPGPALHRPSPNGWRLSGERSGAERVRCSRGLGGNVMNLERRFRESMPRFQVRPPLPRGRHGEDEACCAGKGGDARATTSGCDLGASTNASIQNDGPRAPLKPYPRPFASSSWPKP